MLVTTQLFCSCQIKFSSIFKITPLFSCHLWCLLYSKLSVCTHHAGLFLTFLFCWSICLFLTNFSVASTATMCHSHIHCSLFSSLAWTILLPGTWNKQLLFWLELYWVYRLIQEVWCFHTINSSLPQKEEMSLELGRSSFIPFSWGLIFSTKSCGVFLIKLILDGSRAVVPLWISSRWKEFCFLPWQQRIPSA